MQGSYLNLVIRANSVELHDNSATHDSVVKSVKIRKGDVKTALKECYIFLNEIITSKVIVAVAAVVLGIYFVRRSINNNIT